jgi:probable O-glycosylation ligase (exosortase A-associated)
VSTWGALYPEDALEKLIGVSKIFLMIGIATLIINSDEKLYSLIRIIGYTLGFFALKAGLFAIRSGGTELVYGPEISFLSANNSIGLALGMSMPILAYLIKTERARWVKWMGKAMFLMSIPAIVFTFSRGAWLGLVMAVALTALKSKRKFVAVGVVGILVVLLQAIVPMIAPDRLVKRYDDLVNYENEGSAQSRFWNWEFCRRVGFARPMIGGGFDFYRLETYARFYPEFSVRYPGKVWSCHNSFLSVFGEHGVPGAVVWSWLIGLTFINLRRLRLYARQSLGPPNLKDFADMVQGSLVVFFVVGSFIDAAYFDMFYYLLAFVIIQKGLVARMIENKAVDAAEPTPNVALRAVNWASARE